MKRAINQHLEKFWLTLKDIVAEPARAFKRFQKRRAQRPVKVPYKMGTQIILIHEGKPLAHLGLTRLTFERYGGASAEFVDMSHFLDARKMTVQEVKF